MLLTKLTPGPLVVLLWTPGLTLLKSSVGVDGGFTLKVLFQSCRTHGYILPLSDSVAGLAREHRLAGFPTISKTGPLF